MDDLGQIIERAAPRVCTARRVEAYDGAEVRRRLFAEEGTHGDAMMAGMVSRPSSEWRFDACQDGASLFVTVMMFDANTALLNRVGYPLEEGVGPNCVEVVISPYGDGIGFLQYGIGPAGEKWLTHHWPYRGQRADLVSRPQWEVTATAERLWEDVIWTATFRFPLEGIVPVGYDGPLGFNVMRTQLRTDESSTWSHASGCGFPDATSCGWLRLGEAVPAPPTPAPIHVEKRTPPQLQTTIDFPDEMVGGPYTPELLRREMNVLKDNGFGRIYWIDYPHWIDESRELLADLSAKPAAWGLWRGLADNLLKTVEYCGGDPMPLCARLAHEAGLEFYTVMKPWDAGNPTFPGKGLRRNAAWMPAGGGFPLRRLTLFSDNDRPLGYAPEGIEVFSSLDNDTYEPCSFLRATERVVTRPRYINTPAGKHPTGGTEAVRCIEFEGIADGGPYYALAFPPGAAGSFGNQQFLLAESDGAPLSLSLRANRDQFRDGGFFFFGQGAWSDYTEGVEMRRELGAGATLGIYAGLLAEHPQLPDPSHAEVRDFWVRQWVRRAINCGADGVDVRIAHHSACDDSLAYAFGEPIVEAFRRRTGRDPETRNEDYELLRRIRGEFHTQFLRDAKQVLAESGKRLEAHIEGRMKTGPEFDTYYQVHWDYATWIDEGIVDGINLKYLGPFNGFMREQILARARRRGIPVHLIAAIGDVRAKPRSPEWHREMLSMAYAGGLDGINLYEWWCYMRTTPDLQPFYRGCARIALGELKRRRGELGS